MWSEKGFYPAYFCANEKCQDFIKEFPNGILHKHFDAVKGRMPDGFAEVDLIELGPEEFESYLKYEHMSLWIMDRYDVNFPSFKTRDRLRLFHFFLRFWLTLIKLKDPKYVFFEQEPHGANDFILYSLCKELGIRTVIFTATSLWPLCLVLERFESGSLQLKKKYRDLLLEQDLMELSDQGRSYLKAIRGDHQNAVTYHAFDMEKEFGSLTSPSKLSQRFFQMFGFLVRCYKNFKLNERLALVFKKGHFKSDQKQFYKSFWNSNQGYFEYLCFKFLTICKKKWLRMYYESISESNYPDDQPFIYMALQYQPEKTTAPMGGLFVDQLYLVRLLSQNLPDGWGIMVKEHPAQFVSSYARYGEAERSRKFYKELKSLNNVRLISLRVKSLELIDKSIAVTSITGTNMWEGVIRGKPALAFGFPWFQDCAGVYKIRSKVDLLHALQSIEEKSTFDSCAVDKFLAAAEKVGFLGVQGGDRVNDFFGFSEEDNAEAHANAVKGLLK